MVKQLDNGAKERVIIQIILYCHRINEFSSLLSCLSQLCVVTITTRWEVLLPAMNHTNYDLILLEMPDHENDLFTLLGTLDNINHLTMILLDGSPTPEMLGRAFQCGVSDYFPTPVDQKLLCERIEFLTAVKS